MYLGPDKKGSQAGCSPWAASCPPLIYHLVGIVRNELANRLTFFTKDLNHLSPCKIPAADLLPIHRKLLHKSWEQNGSSLSFSYVTNYRTICPIIPLHPWFLGLDIPK